MLHEKYGLLATRTGVEKRRKKTGKNERILYVKDA
jgi:hypothetical protein